MATKKENTKKTVKNKAEKPVKKIIPKKTVKVSKEKVSSKTIGPVARFHKLTMEKLLEFGAHFGHQSRRWNPKMEKYLWKNDGGVSVFDLEKTVLQIDRACEVLIQAKKDNKRIVFLGTKRQAREAIEKTGKKYGVSYVTERWLGGTITNWDQMSKRISKMKRMVEDKEKGGWSKYTKREQLLMDREVIKLNKMFGGVANLNGPAEVLVVVDVRRERTAVREAKRRNVFVIGIVDSNADPDMIDVVIPMNDDSHQAVEAVVEALGANCK
jgi:small subunit ribosomal protein S2